MSNLSFNSNNIVNPNNAQPISINPVGSSDSIDSFEFDSFSSSSDEFGNLTPLLFPLPSMTTPSVPSNIPPSYEDIEEVFEPVTEDLPKITWPDIPRSPNRSFLSNVGLPRVSPPSPIMEAPNIIGASTSAITRQFVVPPSITRRTL